MSEDHYHIDRIAKLKRTDQAKIGVGMLRVGYLKEAEDMDAIDSDSDVDEEAERAQGTERVPLRMGKWNARPIIRAHVMDIQKQLAAGHNLSRKWPVWIAVNESDITNIEDLVEERQLAGSDRIPILQWRQGVQEVPVLAGQHRIEAARETLKGLAKPLGEGVLAIERLKAKVTKVEKKCVKLKKQEDVDEQLDHAEEELANLKNEMAKTQEKVKQLREQADGVRFWPAVVYSSGQSSSAKRWNIGTHRIDQNREADHSRKTGGKGTAVPVPF